MKYLLNIVFVFCCLTLQSQNRNGLNFDFFNPSIRLYAIGENHHDNNAYIQLEIINYIQQNTKIDVLVLECPNEVGKIFNEYVLTGNKSEEVVNILSLIGKQTSKNTKILLERIKEYNTSIHDSLKIKIIGIDLFGFSSLYHQAKVLSVIFPELREGNIYLVNKVIFNKKKKRYNKNKSLMIIDSLINDIDQNYYQYEKCLGERLPVYKGLLNQLKIENMKDWKKYDSIREDFMTQNLINVIDSNSVSVLICGATHALFKENDTWYYGFPFTSMVAYAKKLYPNEIYSIIIQYHEKKLYRFFPEFNLLSNDLGEYFEDRTKKYEIISDEQLENHVEAKRRCNMIVIQNNEVRHSCDE